jgi:hypothetical protein
MAELDRDRLVWIFTQMARREFEERVKGTFEELRVGGDRRGGRRRPRTR